VPAASSAYHSILNTLEGVSISKRVKCTLSKTGCRADLLIWPYRPIHLLNVHFSGFDMLTPGSNTTGDDALFLLSLVRWTEEEKVSPLTDEMETLNASK
jgi:hypothetical protein